MKIYRVGLIGFGFIGKVHAYGHLNIPLFYDQQEFKSQITHICTSRPETAEKALLQTGALHAVTDFRAIIENPEIDIVDICTPNDLHAEALLSAMHHQKHIYCDKPLVSTPQEAADIRAALPAYRGTAQVTLQNRFFPATLRAKQLLDEGAIGEILEFEGAYLHAGNADAAAPLKWKLTAGTIADLGSHILDLMDYLTGGITRLSGASHIAYPERITPDGRRTVVPAEDNMTVIAQLANGACGTIRASKIATGSEDELRFTIHGSHGAIRFNTMDPHHLDYFDQQAASSPQGGVRGWTAIDCGQRFDPPGGFPTPKAAIGWLRSHMHCLYQFLDAVHTGRPAAPDLAAGLRVEQLMECVRQSCRRHDWQECPPPPSGQTP